MIEGSIAKDLATETKRVSEFCSKNPDMKKLVVKMYLLAEAWAQLKGLELKDVGVEGQRLTNDNKVFWFQFIKDTKDEAGNSPLGILDPGGKVVA